MLKGAGNEQYITGREIGRGGEGQVYELPAHGNLVLKKYNEPLTSVQAAKLRYMVALKNATIDAYAAWPAGLVFDDAGNTCGFVMRKLTGFVPLHMVFSPMDRKKMFPDKGYNFLVHVARNLAVAFYRLHSAGLVVGDVNEGNILISANGTVCFIDCDSFQVKENDTYYFCDVGVPRYTPPELLNEKTFDQVVRTVNTDSFSLAILIFQLLFLGRHPFVGKNKTTKDIDEETAIRQHLFAYSLDNKQKKLLPPNDSFNIADLPVEIVRLFHEAFEQHQRPEPVKWISALDRLLGEMTTCPESRIHTYPSHMSQCPWCQFRRQRGIMYFLDDSYLQSNTVLGDIDSFVNGFHVDKLELKKWDADMTFPDLVPAVTDKDPKWSRRNILAFLATMCVVVAFYLLDIIILSAGLFISLIVNTLYSIWQKRKEDRETGEQLREIYEGLLAERDRVIYEYDHPKELALYFNGLETLNTLVLQYRDLPAEYDRRRKAAEERVYDEQLHLYLQLFPLDSHDIPSFGTAKKTLLRDHGVYTAADISKLATVKIPGIGPKNQQTLFSWQRQMSSGFVYIPNDSRIAEELKVVDKDMEGVKMLLGNKIRREYQSLTYLRLNITNKQLVLASQVNEAAMKTRQAELDMLAFPRFAGR